MAKSSVLTPILAGVLGVSVVGSGIAYYNVYVKNADKDDDAKGGKKNNSNVALSVDQAAENIEEQIDKAQKLAKGEFDGGYKGTVTYTPPSDGEIGQMGIKGITMGAEAKQKDKMSGMDYSVAYDSKSLLTVSVVYDNDNETAYVKIPELSDAYLYGTTDEIESWVNSNVGNPLESFTTVNPSLGGGGYTDDGGDFSFDDYDYGDLDDFTIEDSAYKADGALAVNAVAASSSSTPDLEALENIDFGALFEDLEGYVDTIKENAPEAKDGDDYTVTSGSESITLTTKSYTITADDAKKVAQAVADKGKADTTLKDLFTTMGMTSEDYDSIWSSLTDGLDSNVPDDNTDTLTLDVYYNGDEVQGLKAVPSDNEDNEQIYFVLASDKDKLILDCDTALDGQKITGSGLVTIADDTLNGSLTLKNDADYDAFEFTVSFNGLTANDDELTGGLSYGGKVGDDAFNLKFDFNCKGDDSDVTVTGDVAGQDIGVLNVTSQKTDASDITVPSGTGYKLTDEQQLQSYTESCDVEGWMNTVKEAVGEELYNEIFGAATGSSLSGTTIDDGYDFSGGDTLTLDDIDIGA